MITSAADHQKQPIDAEAEVAERDAAAQVVRELDRLLAGAEHVGRGRNRYEHDADRQQRLVEVGRPIQPAIENAFEHDARRSRRQKATGRVAKNGHPAVRISITVV